MQDCGISSASLESSDALEIPRDWSYVFLALTHWYLLPYFRGRWAEWLLPWSWPSMRRPRNHPLVGDRESDGGGGRKRPQPRRSLVWHARYHVSNVQTNLQSQNLQISLAGMQFSLLCIHKLFHIDFFERLMQRLYIFNLVSLYEEMGSNGLQVACIVCVHGLSRKLLNMTQLSKCMIHYVAGSPSPWSPLANWAGLAQGATLHLGQRITVDLEVSVAVHHSGDLHGSAMFHVMGNSIEHTIWIDILWLIYSGWTQWAITNAPMAQVMACCLTAPSLYLNQCWLLITATSPRGQWVNVFTLFTVWNP